MQVRFGPIRHEELPPDLVSRIRLIRAALLGVYTHSMQFWVDGFRRDETPANEIRIWEHIAACYLEYAAMTPLTDEQRQHAYGVVFGMSVGLERDRLEEDLAALPEGAYEVIDSLFTHAWPTYDVRDEPFPDDASKPN